MATPLEIVKEILVLVKGETILPRVYFPIKLGRPENQHINVNGQNRIMNLGSLREFGLRIPIANRGVHTLRMLSTRHFR